MRAMVPLFKHFSFQSILTFLLFDLQTRRAASIEILPTNSSICRSLIFLLHSLSKVAKLAKFPLKTAPLLVEHVPFPIDKAILEHGLGYSGEINFLAMNIILTDNGTNSFFTIDKWFHNCISRLQMTLPSN